MGMATTQMKASVKSEMTMVRASRSPIKSLTGLFHSKESPKSPLVMMPLIHFQY